MLKKKRYGIFKKLIAISMILSFSLFNSSFALDSYGTYGRQTAGVSESSILNLDSAQRNSIETFQVNDNLGITNSKQRITLSLRDADVQQVIRMLADKAHLNVIFHDSAVGKVTLDLVDVSLNQAFLLVMGACELSYYNDKGTLFISSAEAAKSSSFAKQMLTTIPVKYVNATSVASFLNENVFGKNLTGVSADKVATSNPRTNEVMIFGSKNDADVAKKVIEKLDTKPLINKFKVSHTTPKEMAKLICKTMFGEAEDSASGEDEDNDSASSSSSGTSSASGLQLILGGGNVACKAKSSDTGGDSSVFKGQAVSIVYLEQQGEVGIYGGSYEQAELIKDFIAEHDKKQPMVYLEINIIELNEEGSNMFDTSWNATTPFGTYTFDLDNGFGSAGISIWKDGHFFPWQGHATIGATLKWLIKEGKGRSLSNPKIIATNGQTTKIDLSSDYVKSVDVDISYANGGQSSQPIIERTYNIGDDNGIKIELTPFISPDGYVSLNLNPDYATIKETVLQPSVAGQTGDVDRDIGATLLQRRNLELKNIRIKDGESLVLAGFIQEIETQNVAKVPFLGDLPLIGQLFRSSTKGLSKSELVIMITPHIIYSEDEIAQMRANNL